MYQLGKNKNWVNGVLIYEVQIIDLIGLATYQALANLYPETYKSSIVIKQPDRYYTQLVLSVIVEQEFNGVTLKEKLLDYILNPDDNSPVKPLVNSSPVVKNFPSSFTSNAFWFLFCTIIAILLTVMIVKFFTLYWKIETRYPVVENRWNSLLPVPLTQADYELNLPMFQ